VATGSGFDPVPFGRKTMVPGQANNVFIFPGVGMACLLSSARAVSNAVFLAAARELARCVSRDRLEAGAIYPSQSDLRQVSARVAAAALRQMTREAGDRMTRKEAVPIVEEAMWYPEYASFA
jgi:malic enzyme